METWTKLLGRIEDQSLLILGLVVVFVIWSCFRLLADGVKLAATAYREAEALKASAIVAMAEEIKRGNEICHRHTVHMETIIHNQEICRREMRPPIGGI